MGKKISTKKIYVIDTSVILYDHHSVENFEDNDVAIPIQVLEELDTFKKGEIRRITKLEVSSVTSIHCRTIHY